MYQANEATAGSNGEVYRCVLAVQHIQDVCEEEASLCCEKDDFPFRWVACFHSPHACRQPL